MTDARTVYSIHASRVDAIETADAAVAERYARSGVKVTARTVGVASI